MTAVLAGQTAVAGLLLVYQGYLLNALGSLGSEASPRLKRPYRIGILATLGSFVVADVSALGALLWLVGVDLFWIVVVVAAISLCLLLVVAIATTVLLLR